MHQRYQARMLQPLKRCKMSSKLLYSTTHIFKQYLFSSRFPPQYSGPEVWKITLRRRAFWALWGISHLEYFQSILFGFWYWYSLWGPGRTSWLKRLGSGWTSTITFLAFWKHRDLRLERLEGDYIYAEEGWNLGYTGRGRKLRPLIGLHYTSTSGDLAAYVKGSDPTSPQRRHLVLYWASSCIIGYWWMAASQRVLMILVCRLERRACLSIDWKRWISMDDPGFGDSWWWFLMDHWFAGWKGGYAYLQTGKGDSQWMILGWWFLNLN